MVVLLDQITKIIVLDYMKDAVEEISVFSFLNITLVFNSGIAFGMFSEIGKSFPFIFIFIALFLGLLIFLWPIYKKENYISMGLIAGGAIGNSIDRIRNDAVIDFIDIYWKNFHWPAFNFADISISLGVSIFILNELLYKKGK